MGGYPQEHKGYTLLEVDDGDETRRVFGFEEPGGLGVGEITRGELTMCVFGTDAHFHQITLAERDYERCARLLGAADSPEDAGDLVCQLRIWFGATGFFLSDLMDLLDREGVRYGYLNDCRGAGVSYHAVNGFGGEEGHLRLV
ncbi:hypothetical protein VXJ25_05975 [Olsenella sp. YH-ols2223]|jgi:hypothetical protein|uniref:Uncharacterized protein n=1 Tax=Olsenella absiana TaxID=3115222 RepID=A0ABU7RAA1_9ACTN